MKKHTTTALLIILFVALPLLSIHLGPDDHSAEWDESSALKELQASEAGTVRREQAAQALCREELGAGAVVLWTPDGDLVCRPRPVRVAVGRL